MRLLRVLQDHTLERVGGHRPIPVDVRIVAATHRDLQALDRGGTLPRGPLVPDRGLPDPSAAAARSRGGHPRAREPLRAARRDALRHAAAHPVAGGPRSCSLSYPWPGNVRELIAVIERAVILGDGERLELAKALGVAPAASSAAPRSAAALRSRARASRSSRSTARWRVTSRPRSRARAARSRVPGGAAALLGINPHTLRARMRKLGCRTPAPLPLGLSSLGPVILSRG